MDPLLFNIFINDLSLAVSKLEVILFADDPSLFLTEESVVKLISLFKQFFSGCFDLVDWVSDFKLLGCTYLKIDVNSVKKNEQKVNNF